MNTKSLFLIVAVIAVAGIAVAAFAMGTEPSQDSEQENNEVPETDSYYPVTVTTIDPITNKPRDMTFDKCPERVAVFMGGSLEMMIALGLEDKIVINYGKADYVPSVLDYKPIIDKIGVIDHTTVSKEKIVAADPDFILGWVSGFKGKIGTMDFWAERGVNCYASNRPNVTIDDCMLAVQNVGKIFNVQEKAQEYVDKFMGSVDDIKKKTAHLNESEKPSVLAIEIGYDDVAFCYGSNYITGKLIELAGAKSAFTGGMEKLTYEKIAGLQPDIIILVINSGDFRDPVNIQNLKDELHSIDGFKSMPALKNDRIYAYGLYQVYMSGIIPADTLDNLYNDFYN